MRLFLIYIFVTWTSDQRYWTFSFQFRTEKTNIFPILTPVPKKTTFHGSSTDSYSDENFFGIPTPIPKNSYNFCSWFCDI